MEKWTVYLLWTCISSALCYSYSNESCVRTAVFSGYSDSIRPVLDQSDAVQVHFKLELLNIEALDVRAQTLVTTIWVLLEWVDEKLTWDSNLYDGANKFFVHDGDDTRDVWKPDISVLNTIVKFEKLCNGDLPIVVTNTGEVTMEAGKVIKTHCEIDMTFYPFDTQTCELIIGAWVYTTHEVNMTTEDVNLDNYRENGEWEITSIHAERHDMTFDTEPQSVLWFTFQFARRRPFFVMHAILPMLFLSVLNIIVFVLPPDAGEKMSLAITNLLSFGVFLTLFSDHMPHSSRHTPVISVYLATTFIISVLSVIVSSFVLRLHFRGGPVPSWVKTLYCGCLSKLLFSRNVPCPACNPQVCRKFYDKVESEVIEEDHISQANLSWTSGKKGTSVSSAPQSNENESRRQSVYHVIDWRQIAGITDWMALLGFTITTLVVGMYVVFRLTFQI